MAFREIEPSTPRRFAAFKGVPRATRDRSAPQDRLATQSRITTYRSADEHDGELRVGNEKQASARLDLSLRAKQAISGAALRIHVRR